LELLAVRAAAVSAAKVKIRVNDVVAVTGA
jgi:hypothetical protein